MKEYNAIYRGVVAINEDPQNIGRCKIRIPSIHGASQNPNILPWARPVASSTINEKRGTVNIPDVGDIVWVVFEAGDLQYPVYLGGMYSNRDIQVNKDRIIIYVEEDNAIVYDRVDKSYTINIGKSIFKIKEDNISAEVLGTSFSMREGNLDLEVGDSSMTLDSEGITVNGNLKVSGNISTDSSLYVSGEYPCRAD